MYWFSHLFLISATTGASLTPTQEEIRISDADYSCDDAHTANEALQNYSNTLVSTDTDRASRNLAASILSGLTTGHFKMEVVEKEQECGNSSYITDIISDLSSHFAEAGNYLKNIPASCENIVDKFPAAPSGYYTIMVNNETSRVYCYMNGTNCGGGGWTRVAFFNMSESGATCPNGLTFLQYSNLDHPVCGKPLASVPGCVSMFFPSHGLNYSSVCGRMRGYQYGSPDAFRAGGDIDNWYVDGYSITYGSPRQHIWTYAGGVWQKSPYVEDSVCPCNTNGNDLTVPSFVASNYYCESAIPVGEGWDSILYADDPLWDGEHCIEDEVPCCTNNMPWFSRPLGTTTNDDIEVRLCGNQISNDEDTPMDVLELYIR